MYDASATKERGWRGPPAVAGGRGAEEPRGRPRADDDVDENDAAKGFAAPELCAGRKVHTPMPTNADTDLPPHSRATWRKRTAEEVPKDMVMWTWTTTWSYGVWTHFQSVDNVKEGMLDGTFAASRMIVSSKKREVICTAA